MTDIYNKTKRSEIMSRVKHRRTAPEEKVAKLLRKLGIRYRRNVKSLPGEPDFVIGSVKVAIFVHGCFWHGHYNCNRAKPSKTNTAFWNCKIERNRKRDTRTARLLRKKGWHVMTIWQCKLRHHDRILRMLKIMLAVGRNEEKCE